MKFIVTKELGRLAKWLRILGYDVVYFRQENRSSLLISALREGRVVLTRNSRLSSRGGLKVIKIKSDLVREQIKQTLTALNLKPDKEEMFSRCIICNEILQDLRKEETKGKVPDFVFQTQEEFVRCPMCLRIYWQGTHWGNVQKYLSQITTD